MGPRPIRECTMEVPQHISAELADQMENGDVNTATLEQANKAELLTALALVADFDVDFVVHETDGSVSVKNGYLEGVAEYIAQMNAAGGEE